ncbi:MAG: hypothetical protein AB1432_01345 [Bacteroidota bacterium]|jgi:hypothetical protein
MTLSTYKLNAHQFLICIEDGKVEHHVTADKCTIGTVVICYAYAIGYRLKKIIKSHFIK